jgi:hypothetical protein
MPLGMVDLSKLHEDPRPIFHSSCRPTPGGMAINDFTSKHTEPEIVFPQAWFHCLTWLWNLCITYPWVEFHLGNDDVSGAFRQVTYNPNLGAMHAFLVLGVIFMSTGQTFGDCTRPANWEPVVRNQQQYIWYLWHQETTLARAFKHLSNLQSAATPSKQIIESFVQATTPDTLNHGVLDAAGAWLAPQYNHHVNDCLYADIKESFPLTVAASIFARYLLLGKPSANQHQDPGCPGKNLCHIYPCYKRDQVIEMLELWLL